MVYRKIYVKGRVQGVWFRASTREAALRLGVSGYVVNLRDGSVYCEVSGPEAAVEQLIEWCRHGPRLAKVEQVIIEELPPSKHEGFEIRR